MLSSFGRSEVNDLLGDIVKVTPSSKVVGDLAIFLLTKGVEPRDMVNLEPGTAFPESVVDMLSGGLGQPKGGWPKAGEGSSSFGENCQGRWLSQSYLFPRGCYPCARLWRVSTLLGPQLAEPLQRARWVKRGGGAAGTWNEGLG